MYRHPLSHYFLVLLTLSHHADFALFGCDCAHPQAVVAGSPDVDSVNYIL